jgi:hypothetical protein
LQSQSLRGQRTVILRWEALAERSECTGTGRHTAATGSAPPHCHWHLERGPGARPGSARLTFSDFLRALSIGRVGLQVVRTPSISEAFAALGSGVVCVSSMAPVRLGIAHLLSRCQPSKASGCRCCFAACSAPQLLSVCPVCLSSVCPVHPVLLSALLSALSPPALESVPAACRATLARCACLYLRHLTIRGACPQPSERPTPDRPCSCPETSRRSEASLAFPPSLRPFTCHTLHDTHPSTVTPPGTCIPARSSSQEVFCSGH